MCKMNLCKKADFRKPKFEGNNFAFREGEIQANKQYGEVLFLYGLARRSHVHTANANIIMLHFTDTPNLFLRVWRLCTIFL